VAGHLAHEYTILARADGMKRTTIYDLAKLADSSPGTVSAVLHGDWRKRRISVSLAERIRDLAKETGYAINMQASALRKERSGIIGMIVPMYDNRYFSTIAQQFEQEARARELFPIVTCTSRDPVLEEKAARQMVAYRVEHLICTGATDPDRLSDICAPHGVRTTNLDLPGGKATSIISDNFAGAHALTERLLGRIDRTDGTAPTLLFVGGRASDHCTTERVRGFTTATASGGIAVPTHDLLTCGYAAPKAKASLDEYLARAARPPDGIFVNSTTSLEGVLNWAAALAAPERDSLAMVCFDWDPFVAALGGHVTMVKQNVTEMIRRVFAIVDSPETLAVELIEIPPQIVDGSCR